MARLLPQLLQARSRPGPGKEEVRLEAELVPSDLDVRFQQLDDPLRGPLHLSGRIQSACLYPPRAQGDHAELLLE